MSVSSLKKGKPSQVYIEVINAGKSPGRVLRFSTAARAYRQFPESPEYTLSSGTPSEYSRIIVLPGKPISASFATLPFTEKDLNMIGDGTARYHVYATIEYEDLNTAKVHTTRICYFYRPSAEKFSYCPYYNEAD